MAEPETWHTRMKVKALEAWLVHSEALLSEMGPLCARTNLRPIVPQLIEVLTALRDMRARLYHYRQKGG